MARRSRRSASRADGVAKYRQSDPKPAVSRAGQSVEIAAEEEEQIRQRLADYFAILREWDVRLKQSESEDTFDFHRP